MGAGWWEWDWGDVWGEWGAMVGGVGGWVAVVGGWEMGSAGWGGGVRFLDVDGISERERLRRTFDAVAEEYQGARPEYPDALYEALIGLTGVVADRDELCEVGCASGKATLPLARRGFAISCVELGGALAAEARRNLAGFGRVRVDHADFESWNGGVGHADSESWTGGVGHADSESWTGGVGHADFESWTPGQSAGTVRDDGVGGFGLVFAATAWHWIDPAVKYRKAWSLLRPGGHLAFWTATHVVPESGGDPFFAEIQDVYDEIGVGDAGRLGLPHPGHAAGQPGRDRGERAVRRCGRPAVRLGGQVHRG